MGYTKKEFIGKGAFGQVYQVEDDSGNEFAMKTLEPQPQVLANVSEEELLRRFRREVSYQMSIKHPNVVRILDVDLSSSPPYFVMELAEQTLADELGVDHTLGGEPKKALFDVLAGLEALHENGFIHRDLKPQNILKIVNNDGVRYAISDFGLMTAGDGSSTTLTATGTRGGTENYAAPELLVDFKRATRAADIYSYGAILHDIFDGGNRVPYTELNVNGAIGDVVSRCTKRLPIRRYDSIESLRDDLYDVLEDDDLVFGSKDEEYVITLLSNSDKLSDDEWDRVFLLIEDNIEKGITNQNIYRAISKHHILQLAQTAPELLASLGDNLAEYIARGTFDFDYCDVLAAKLENFYELGDINLQAQVVLALLSMGVSHNRWFVEHKFMKLAGLGISETLANRIKIEIDAQDFDFVHHIKHVERSIHATSRQLHPVLQQILEQQE